MLEELKVMHDKIEKEIPVQVVRINAQQYKMEKEVIMNATKRAELVEKCQRQDDHEKSMKQIKESKKVEEEFGNIQERLDDQEISIHELNNVKRT